MSKETTWLEIIENMKHHYYSGVQVVNGGQREIPEETINLPDIKDFRISKEAITDPWDRAKRYESGEHALFTYKDLISDYMRLLFGFKRFSSEIPDQIGSAELSGMNLQTFRKMVAHILEMADFGDSLLVKGIDIAEQELLTLVDFLSNNCPSFDVSNTFDITLTNTERTTLENIFFFLERYLDRCKNMRPEEKEREEEIMWGCFSTEDREGIKNWLRSVKENLRSNQLFATYIDQVLNNNTNEGRGLFNKEKVDFEKLNSSPKTEEARQMAKEFSETMGEYTEKYKDNDQARMSIILQLISSLGGVFMDVGPDEGIFAPSNALSVRDRAYLLEKRVLYLAEMVELADKDPVRFWDSVSNREAMWEFLGKKSDDGNRVIDYGLTASLSSFVDKIVGFCLIDSNPIGFLNNELEVLRSLLIFYINTLQSMNSSVVFAIRSGKSDQTAIQDLDRLLNTPEFLSSDFYGSEEPLEDCGGVLYSIDDAISIIESAIKDIDYFLTEIPDILED